MKKTLIVEGMSCGHCEKAVKEALNKLQGVSRVEVNLGEKEVLVEGENLDNRVLREAIDEAGYDVVKID